MTTSHATPAPLSTREIWKVIPVRRLLISNAVLYSGIALQATALLKQAYDITGRKSDLGWMGLAEFLPIIMLVLVTGSVADHFNRKAIALITVGAEVVTSAGLMFYALSKPTSVVPLFGIAFAVRNRSGVPGSGDAGDATDGCTRGLAAEGDRLVLGGVDRGDHRRSRQPAGSSTRLIRGWRISVRPP